MRAFLSGPNEFGTANDYCRRVACELEWPALAYNASATEAWVSSKQRLALREAEAILAATEPYGPDSGHMPLEALDTRVSGEALADSLAAFLEQEL